MLAVSCPLQSLTSWHNLFHEDPRLIFTATCSSWLEDNGMTPSGRCYSRSSIERRSREQSLNYSITYSICRHAAWRSLSLPFCWQQARNISTQTLLRSAAEFIQQAMEMLASYHLAYRWVTLERFMNVMQLAAPQCNQPVIGLQLELWVSSAQERAPV